MQAKMQKFGKLIFLALVFGSLVGCGSDDSDGSGAGTFGGETDGNNSTNVTAEIVPEIKGYFALQVGADVFPEPNRHIFGDWWDSASIETHSVKFSSLNSEDKAIYEDEVREEFPDVLQIGYGGVYHNLAYYQGNFIGDASIEIVNDAPDSYSVIKAVDLILPIPVFVNKVDGGVFSNGHIFPELIGFPITEVITTIHYGYFGSPNLQTYKIKLLAEGFSPLNGKNDDNIWTKDIVDSATNATYTYTFEHDNLLLDATWITNPLDDIFTAFGLDGIIDYQIPGFGTIAGITNHWLGNWTNINKFARWKVSVKK